jgi:hypothetical protein
VAGGTERKSVREVLEKGKRASLPSAPPDLFVQGGQVTDSLIIHLFYSIPFYIILFYVILLYLTCLIIFHSLFFTFIYHFFFFNRDSPLGMDGI